MYIVILHWPSTYAAAEDAGINANEDIVHQLVSMGFQYLHCQKAAISTSNTGVEEAMNWLLNHMSDPGISHPLLFQRVCVSISFMFMD